MPVISLQGELGAFGVDDVLALVSTKVGALQLRAGDREARIHLDAGEIVAASDGSSTGVVEVVSGLLRWTAGEFTFLDGERPPVAVPGRPIAEVLGAARASLAEWLDVETVIPSTRSVIALAPEAPSVDVRLAPSEWVAVAAVGSGSVAAVAAAAIGNSLLFGMQVLKGLVERGLVVVGAEVEPPAELAPIAAPVSVDLREHVPPPEAVPQEARDEASEAPLEAVVEAPTSGLAASADVEERKRVLGHGNGQLRSDATGDERKLPDLHSIEPFPQPSSSVQSLARVLDAVNDVAADDDGTGTGPEDDRVALLKELEALRDGIRSAAPLAAQAPEPEPATPKIPVEGSPGRRS